MTKLNNLVKGKTVQLTHGDIETIVNNTPNLSNANYQKLNKAYMSGKGVRINLGENELAGCGFASMARKGAKAIKNNKQLAKLKDQAINQGLNYAVNQAGLDEDTGNLVKNLGRKTLNNQFDNLAGSGFAKMARKGAKAIKNNKQLTKFKDQAINQGLNYAVNQAGLDEDTGNLVKNLGRKTINNQFDNLAGGSIFNKKLGRKILKTGSKALKVGNKISNTMGYDDLDDMAIDFATKQTLGRIDPTLGSIAANQLNRLADKQIERHGGSINPYMPTIRGSGLSDAMTFDDLSSNVHPNHDAYIPKAENEPMFDRLKMQQQFYKQANSPHFGSGFRVNA